MGGFLDRCVQNGFLSKETTGEPQRTDEGKCIDFWDRLSPEQKGALSSGSLERLGNTQETEKSNSSQIGQQGNNYRFRPSDFTLEFQERQHKQPDRDSQTRLIQEYLQAVEEVTKNKKLPTEEKLKKLLTPLINLCDITFPPGYESNRKFIAEDIDPEKELDLKNLIFSPKQILYY
ncbi:MAG: hypothetical protein UZ01_00588 [Candidatus Brocadia sinica]|uniref:Uncharacterized protein n=1 Tax=Candidatus Brocadia sinica JPN1 TaxID=1197129 RepID=A0ABQ0JST0_9BACT|nr:MULTISPECIES: hypothetical protein [Brocadia]KXK32257.1 MAG: hypothetical protein UZ01_00588 [Candidatus Brocadia sinica]MBC6934041.1 hypothetical protein [Candidatus Brocadia sp.]MBL1170333.1 hypothetical protein [Candidatus Brocadia sp. AMX1]NOG43366.1 hypothetical protein [Planctomycetota bacterium]MCK6469951.1 hypothetical protein [Candidatus Brocadia sinica]